MKSSVRSVAAAHELKLRLEYRYRYLLYRPAHYNGRSGKRWPLVVFFHGKGECGSDLALVEKHGPPKEAAAGRDFPFLLAAPQSPLGQWWNYVALDAFVAALIARYRVDPARVYLTGLSMGGFATWMLAELNPQRYAAVAPVCGGGEPRHAERLKDLPVWAFHGALDPVIPLSRSQEMIAGIRAAGGRPRLTVYPKAGHDSWTRPYAGTALYDWLLKHHR